MSAAGDGRSTLTAVPGLEVGHADDPQARTGCTAILGPFRGAVEVRGQATGTRELDALSPLHVVPRCDALLLTGGSAFGLAAADGVVRWLEERGRGFATPAARVPVVPAAVLYDLSVGDASVRPDPAMGHRAAGAAGTGPVAEGAVGAGTGATVGKLRGGDSGEDGGLGSAADVDDGPAVGALAVVNAFGDVVDAGGRIVAGARDGEGAFLDTERAIREGEAPSGFGEPPGSAGGPGVGPRRPGGAGPAGLNTTLAVVATDAPLDARALRRVARRAAHGLVRRVRPAATPFDGDVVFAVSTAESAREVAIDEVLRIGLRAQEALERAIERAVRGGVG